MFSLRLLLGRLLAIFAADRVVVHRVVETTVMGRAAVLCTATAMTVVAFVQFFSETASATMTDFAGEFGATLWAASLLIAAVLVWASRFIRPVKFALALEIPGTFLLGLTIAEYGMAVLAQLGFTGTVFIVALSFSVALNLFGRVYMLVQRIRSAWIVDRQLKGLL